MNRKLTIVHSQDINEKMLAKGVFSKRLITGPKDGSDRFMLSLLRMEPGSSNSGVYTEKDEAIFILKGCLKIKKEGKDEELAAGDTVFIPMGTFTDMKNTGPEALQAIAVIAPSKRAEEL